jgi:hypothetical protein
MLLHFVVSRGLASNVTDVPRISNVLVHVEPEEELLSNIFET